MPKTRAQKDGGCLNRGWPPIPPEIRPKRKQIVKKINEFRKIYCKIQKISVLYYSKTIAALCLRQDCTVQEVTNITDL